MRRNNLTRDYNKIEIQMKLKIIIGLNYMYLPKLQTQLDKRSQLNYVHVNNSISLNGAIKGAFLTSSFNELKYLGP